MFNQPSKDTNTHEILREHDMGPGSDGPSRNGTDLRGQSLTFIGQHKQVEGTSMVTKLNSVAFSPQANYTDRATAACRRS
jgi:hypothetical protein